MPSCARSGGGLAARGADIAHRAATASLAASGLNYTKRRDRRRDGEAQQIEVRCNQQVSVLKKRSPALTRINEAHDGPFKAEVWQQRRVVTQ